MPIRVYVAILGTVSIQESTVRDNKNEPICEQKGAEKALQEPEVLYCLSSNTA
jgi:hypothetical protein